MYYYGLFDSDNLECVLGFSPLDFNLFILKLLLLGSYPSLGPGQHSKVWQLPGEAYIALTCTVLTKRINS